MTIDTEKLRALLAAGTPGEWRQGNVERWHVFGDVGNCALMVPEFGRVVARTNEHYPSHDHDAALIAAAVNALPELLDALADVKAQLAFAIAGGAPSGPPCVVCESLEDAQAKLATAEAERLTLARAFDAATRDLDCGDNSCRFKAHGKGGMRTNGGCSCLGVKDGGGMRGLEVSRAVEVARRIVAEADAASKVVGS